MEHHAPMTNTTPMFSGFHIHTLRKPRRTAQKVLADQVAAIRRKSFSQLDACFGRYLSTEKLKPKSSGNHSRQRLYSLFNTFWVFFSQVLEPDGGCREAVAKLQAHAALQDLVQPSASTAAYCRARAKICEEDLKTIFEHSAQSMKESSRVDYIGNRRVVVVDGTGLSMPDTEENQSVWPQTARQKPGCGFPSMKVSAFFTLNNSALISFKTGSKHDSEQAMFRSQWNIFERGDIFLGDKLYCSFYDLSMLKERGVDSVVGLDTNKHKPVKTKNAVKKLSGGDLLIEWQRPTRHRSTPSTRENIGKLPETLRLRQVRMKISVPGGRQKTFHIITTLLDPVKYPPEKLLCLYRHRWEVELFFRDIKTSMGMDILRCKTPSMIRKEVLMHFIVYNCIRSLIYESCRKFGGELKRISFKASVQTVRHWAPYLQSADAQPHKRKELLQGLFAAIARSHVIERPGRHEPRCKKRRDKCYQKLNAYRHEMIPTEQRGVYHYKNA